MSSARKMPLELRRRFSGGNVEIGSGPIAVADAARSCDLAVTHGGGTSTVLLQAGKPVLLLPRYVEQEVLARRAQDLGVGIGVTNPKELRVTFQTAVRRLVEDTDIRGAARRFSEKTTAHSGPSVALRMADLVQEYLNR